MVKYTYDAWGKVLSITGNKAGTIGVINPLRYRSYVYDEETGLYFLQSQYYAVKDAVATQAMGLMPGMTSGFGEMMKGFFGSLDDALVYMFCE